MPLYGNMLSAALGRAGAFPGGRMPFKIKSMYKKLLIFCIFCISFTVFINYCAGNYFLYLIIARGTLSFFLL